MPSRSNDAACARQWALYLRPDFRPSEALRTSLSGERISDHRKAFGEERGNRESHRLSPLYKFTDYQTKG